MSRRGTGSGGGAKKKAKSDPSATAASPVSSQQSAAAPAPSKKLRRLAEAVYPAGRTAIVYSNLTPCTPMLAYDAALLLDKGFAPSRWSVARLAEEALFLETAAARYELLAEGTGFVLSRLRQAAIAAVPVADEGKEAVARAESWQGVVWRPDGVVVGGTALAGVVALRWERFTGVAYV